MLISDEQFEQQLAYCRQKESQVGVGPGPASPFGFLYNRAGEVIDMANWLVLNNDKRYQIIEQSQAGPFWVSTVWTGMNSGPTPPLIFETMVFLDHKPEDDEEGLGTDQYQERYTTEEEARAGHLRVFLKYQEVATAVIKTRSDLKKWLASDKKEIRRWAISEMAKLPAASQETSKPKTSKKTDKKASQKTTKGASTKTLKPTAKARTRKI